MSDRKIRIGIETTGDTKAVDDATKKVDNLSKKNEDSAKSSGKAAKGGIDAAKGFATLGQTAAASSGSIGGLASALGGMAQQLPALAGAAGPIGLAIAAFMAWKSAIDAVIASQASLDKGLRDTAIGNTEAAVRSLSEAYDRLGKSIATAAEDARAYTAAENERDDAELAAELAALDLEKAQRLSGLDTGDDIGKRAMELDISERRAAATDAAARRKADREAASIRVQSEAAAAEKALASEQIGELESKYSSLGAQYADVNAQTTRRANQWWRTPASSQRIAEAGSRELKDIQEAMDKVAQEIAKATEDRRNADRALSALAARAEVAEINRSALVTTQQTGFVQRSAERSGIVSEAAARAQAARAAQSRERELESARGEVETAEGDLARARSVRPAGVSGGLRARWGNDGRIRSDKDLADEAGRAAEAADRAVREAAARLAAARKRFEDLERSMKNQRDND